MSNPASVPESRHGWVGVIHPRPLSVWDKQIPIRIEDEEVKLVSTEWLIRMEQEKVAADSKIQALEQKLRFAEEELVETHLSFSIDAALKDGLLGKQTCKGRDFIQACKKNHKAMEKADKLRQQKQKKPISRKPGPSVLAKKKSKPAAKRKSKQ